MSRTIKNINLEILVGQIFGENLRGGAAKR